MWRISLTHYGVAVVRAERATGAPKARQAESTPAQAEHARWQMVESPGCARSAPLERRRRDGRSARQRRRSTLAQVTGEARIILRCSEAHPQATLSTLLKSKLNGYQTDRPTTRLRASQSFWPIRGEEKTRRGAFRPARGRTPPRERVQVEPDRMRRSKRTSQVTIRCDAPLTWPR